MTTTSYNHEDGGDGPWPMGVGTLGILGLGDESDDEFLAGILLDALHTKAYCTYAISVGNDVYTS